MENEREKAVSLETETDAPERRQTESFSRHEGGDPIPPGYHRHSDGTVHCHRHLEDGSISPEHEHDHLHSHGHTHTQTKAVLNRLSRAIGHLESVRSMVENGRDCTEVLIQLAAVRSALSSTAKVILKDHLEHCICEEGSNTEEQLRALNDAIDKFMQ